jgi:hypothetical protein
MIPKWGSFVVSSESWTSSAIQNGTKYGSIQTWRAVLETRLAVY